MPSPSPYGPSFDVGRENSALVAKIADRVEKAGAWVGSKKKRADQRLTLLMDLEACHANGCPMDFHGLLEADDFNFWHDVNGIQQHMDRRTGALMNHFLPRFAARTTVRA